MAITYTCPSCGAGMEFDAASGKLHCEYCETYMSVNDYQTQYGDAKEDAAQQEHAQQGNGKTSKGNVNEYHCSTCGATLVADENTSDEHTSASICAFCGNPTLVYDHLTGEFTPDSVIPFSIDKEQAKGLVKRWMGKGLLTPSNLKSESVLEKITGIYVPFWLYDYDCQDHMTANATRTRHSSDMNYYYHYTDHFHVTRHTSANFRKIPADASSRMPDDIMDKLEPFDYGKLNIFEMPYLAGFMSEKFNYSADEIENRTRQRAVNYITEMTRSSIQGYSSVTVVDNNVQAVNTRDEYALLPVWILNYNYKGVNHKLYMNGQTGKIVADRPVSNVKSVVAGAIIFVIVFIILWFIRM